MTASYDRPPRPDRISHLGGVRNAYRLIRVIRGACRGLTPPVGCGRAARPDPGSAAPDAVDLAVRRLLADLVAGPVELEELVPGLARCDEGVAVRQAEGAPRALRRDRPHLLAFRAVL